MQIGSCKGERGQHKEKDGQSDCLVTANNGSKHSNRENSQGYGPAFTHIRQPEAASSEQ